ncbi:MAG: S-adenosylmethionine:tRNA ribosyltransferase-isomerase [Acidimicrobiales bacterium]
MPATGQSQGLAMDAFDYALPDAAIAQRPVEPRSAARMLVTGALSDAGEVGHATVADLPHYLRPGDVLVVNHTRVLAARLALVKQSGGAAEVLLLEPAPSGAGAQPAAVWEALVRPGRRLPPGTQLWEPAGSAETGSEPAGSAETGSGPTGAGPVVEVGDPVAGHDDGRRWVRLMEPSVVDRAGSMPLPPYIHTPLQDPERYQTVYCAPSDRGAQSTAAPTAGLHLTPAVLDACRAAGASIATVDLAIGLDTFRPVTAPTPEEHVIHSERYAVPAETMEACRQASRVVAIGTTTVRALESAAATGRLSGRTDLYIHGDYPFSVVDVLLTNFHMPRSTLLLMVEAFCGPEWRDLYSIALEEGYRFLSFGDAMLVANRASSYPDGRTGG